MLNSVTTARLTLHLPSEKVSFASKDSCQPYILPQITLPSIKVSIYQWITSLLPFYMWFFAVPLIDYNLRLCLVSVVILI